MFGLDKQQLHRIRRCGGFKNFLQMYARNNFEGFWTKIMGKPGTKWNDTVNCLNSAVLIRFYNKHIPRVNHYSLKSDYATVESMYDESRSYYSRVLPSNHEYGERLIRTDPGAVKAAQCFERKEFKPEPNQNLSLLIGFYAQWFSHQFFNTHPQSAIPNTNPTELDYSQTYKSNQPVGLNLSQLYGKMGDTENTLRSFKNGKLKSTRLINGEYPQIVDPKTAGNLADMPYWASEHGSNEAFLMPIGLANMVPGFAAIQTVFLRHHQYVATELLKANPDWDDERLFQMTKIIVLLSCLKVTMNDYVANALQTSKLKLHFDGNIRNSMWYKLFVPKNFESINAIQMEFNLLYRWHQFYGNELRILKELNENVNVYNKNEYNTLHFPSKEHSRLTHWNSVNYFKGEIDSFDYQDGKNKDGFDSLELLLLSSAQQHAGQLTLCNTHPWLATHIVRSGLLKTRHYGLASYNDYREYFGFGRMKSFEEISSNPEIVTALKNAYSTVDDIEFYTGIFAEDKDFGGIHGPFLATIGVGFTFCGIFASRLFNTEIVNEKLLSNRGMELLENVNLLKDLVKLHTKLGETDLWKNINFQMNEDYLLKAKNGSDLNRLDKVYHTAPAAHGE